MDASFFSDLFYRNPTYNELAQPFLSAKHVKSDAGTGLVHTVYAHGHDDYQLGIERGEKIECFVDEDGRYTRQMGHSLEGRDVLSEETTNLVLATYRKHVVHSAPHSHKYPYDWRTKKVSLPHSYGSQLMPCNMFSQY